MEIPSIVKRNSCVNAPDVGCRWLDMMGGNDLTDHGGCFDPTAPTRLDHSRPLRL
jgi:hypothetical protein